MNDQAQPRREKTRGPKQQLLGNPANQISPTWKPTVSSAQSLIAQCDKILLSKLPADIQETEIEELFQKTVGPVKECLVVNNSQGKSKGMAIITFQRPGDAIVARAKYNGKIVDGRHTLKIEIIYDVTPPTTGFSHTPSLLSRLGTAYNPLVMGGPLQPNQPYPQRQHQILPPLAVLPVMPVASTKRRIKKGPKRARKRQAATKDQLDKEIDNYRARASPSLML